MCQTPIIIPSLVLFDGEAEFDELVTQRDGKLRSIQELVSLGDNKKAVAKYIEFFGEDEHYARQAITAIDECGISDGIGVWEREKDPELKDRIYKNVEKTPGRFDRTAIIYGFLAVLFLAAILIKWFE
jgi:hypothetical protein